MGGSDADDRMLPGLRVLDLSDCPAGQFASRIMADCGAWVALVEPPDGSPVRRQGPFRPGVPSESLLFWHLNGGKSSIQLDRADPARWGDLVELCRRVDVLIVADPDLAGRLAANCPDQIVGLVRDFGPDGPYAAWKGCEMVFQALSGTMHVTGRRELEPLYGVGQRASYAAGLWLYIGVVAALCGRARHKGRFGFVEVSLHEAAVAMEENFSLRWTYAQDMLPKGGDTSRSVSTFPSSDGWVTIMLLQHDQQFRDLCALIGAPGLVHDPRFSDWTAIYDNWYVLSDEIGKYTVNKTTEELVGACEKAGIIVAKMETGLSLREEAHLLERGFWQEVQTPDGPRVNLGPLFRSEQVPTVRNRPAPAIGDNAPLPERRRGAQLSANIAEGAAPRPLSGVCVIDMTTAWAGPMAGKILGQLGADVIKLESPRRLDLWRGLLNPTKNWLYADAKPGPRPYNRSVLFNNQNLDKRGIGLDLKSQKALGAMRRIASRADLIIANFRMGALARLGLSFPALSPVNEKISVVEMPAVGAGPFAHRAGLGPTMESMAGITALIGHSDGRPLGSGSSYMDPMGALHGAAASLTALYRQFVTGKGAGIEVAQREAAMHWIGEYLLETIESGRQRPLAGNAVDTAAPHDAFPASDGWVAIGVFDEDEWRALCAELALPHLVGDPRFANLAARIANRDTLYGLVAERTQSWPKAQIAARLQAAGVRAAPVADGRDLYEDAHLRASGWFTRLSHPDTGTYDYSGYPLQFDGARIRPQRTSPLFDEHTREVLAERAGLSAQEIDEFYRDGICSAEPIPETA